MDLSLNVFVERLRVLDNTSDLWQLMLEYFHQHGIAKVSYHHYRGLEPVSPLSPDVTVMADGFPDDWVCHYLDEALYRIDPIPELARRTPGAFFWNDVAAIAAVTPEQSRYLEEMEEAGLGNGLAFQVLGPNMRNAYVGLGARRGEDDLASPQVAELRAAAQLAHLRYCEIEQSHEQDRMNLSPREREILHWIAKGKSNGVIAQILSISPHTIDTLVRRIFDKLGVSDRTSAAIKGLGSGLVAL